MNRLHFYLEKRKGMDGNKEPAECPVILSFSFSSIRIKTYTGKKVRITEWDSAVERIKTIYARAQEYNSYFDHLEERINQYFTERQYAASPPDLLLLKKEIKMMVKSEVPSFFVLFLRFIEENHPKWSISTYKKMKTFYSQLREFSLRQYEPIHPGMVNKDFAEKLIEFYREKNLKDTSIKKNLDLLKWFMNWSLSRKLIINRDFEHIRFSPGKSIEIGNEIFLKWFELTRFYAFHKLLKKEEWARDVFCFIAFSGLRFSMIKTLKKPNFEGNYIHSVEPVNRKVLLNRFSREICNKYQNRYYRNNTLFPAMSLITFHKHLRSAAFKSGLNRLIYSPSPGALQVSLHNLISSRIAVNSFYANAVKLDIQTGPGQMFNAKSARSRILELSGAWKLAEEKQISTSNLLYESLKK